MEDEQIEKYTTFFINERPYGIDVMRVQEVTRSMPMTSVPLAPDYVAGLINLRGQIATAIELRNLFSIPGAPPTDQMNVVCRIDGMLFSFLVDKIGDVTEVAQNKKDPVPASIGGKLRDYISGIYRMPNDLLSIIDVDKLAQAINLTNKGQQ